MEYTEREKKNTLRMAVVTAMTTTFMGSAINLCVPALETQFHAGAVTVGWVVTAYTLVIAAVSVPLGKLADATGRRRVLLIGITLFGLLSVACIFATSIQMLIMLRVAQGIASAMIFSTNNALLLSVYPGSQRGRVLGLSVTGTYFGLSAGPVLGGILNQHFGWESIFVVTAVICAAALVLALKGAPADQGTGLDRIDIQGNLLFIAMIILTLYGFSILTEGYRGPLILAAGLVCMAAFVWVEDRAEDPVIRISMFTRDRMFTCSNLAALLNYGATFAIGYLVSIYLQVVMGYDSQTAGLILIVMPLMQTIFSPAMGRLSDRIAPYKLASAGMALTAGGLVLFAFLGLKTPLWYVIGALGVVGMGFAMFSSPNTNAIMSRVDRSEYGVANSITATMRTYGHSASMVVVTLVAGLLLGNEALESVPAEALVHTIHVSFSIFIVLCVIGIGLSLARAREL